MNILISQMVGLNFYKDDNEEGVRVSYYLPDNLKNIFKTELDLNINVVFIEDKDYPLLSNNNDRNLKILSRLSFKENYVNVVISSSDIYYDKLMDFFGENVRNNLLEDDETLVLKGTRYTKERMKKRDLLIPIHKKRKRVQKPKRIQDI